MSSGNVSSYRALEIAGIVQICQASSANTLLRMLGLTLTLCILSLTLITGPLVSHAGCLIRLSWKVAATMLFSLVPETEPFDQGFESMLLIVRLLRMT